MNVDSRIFGTHKPLLTQTGFDLQLLETYKINNLAQNDIILLFMSISKGYLPSSPYIIYDGVDDLQNFK
jgi:hypothetical protein